MMRAAAKSKMGKSDQYADAPITSVWSFPGESDLLAVRPHPIALKPTPKCAFAPQRKAREP